MKEVSNEKIGTLRDIILDRADAQKKDLTTAARREAEEWMLKETEKLQNETNIILQDRYSLQREKNLLKRSGFRTGYFQKRSGGSRTSWSISGTVKIMPIYWQASV